MGTALRKHVCYLQEEDELWKALDGLNHEAIESDPVQTRCLLPLETEKGRLGSSITENGAETGVTGSCLHNQRSLSLRGGRVMDTQV